MFRLVEQNSENTASASDSFKEEFRLVEVESLLSKPLNLKLESSNFWETETVMADDDSPDFESLNEDVNEIENDPFVSVSQDSFELSPILPTRRSLTSHVASNNSTISFHATPPAPETCCSLFITEISNQSSELSSTEEINISKTTTTSSEVKESCPYDIELSDENESEKIEEIQKEKSKTKRKKKNKPVVCDKCNKILSSRTVYKSHERRHTNERPFKCSECISSHLTKGALQQHMKKVHEAKRAGRSFVCNHAGCSKSFWTKDVLDQHVRVHKGSATIVKVYPCEICPDKSYKFKSSLIHHLQTHDRLDFPKVNNTTYQCNDCSKSFSWKFFLEEHKLKHEKYKS